MRVLLSLLFVISCIFCSSVSATEGGELSAQEFMQRVREPLRQEAWGEFTGRLVHVRKGQPKLKGNLRVRITVNATAFYAQLVLNDTNVYGLEQMHETAGKIAQHIDMPQEEAKPGLFDFGLAPSDLSFAFIYWDFVKEMSRQSSRWRDCRVMRLAAPDKTGYVDVWFDAEHGFPMEAEWYRNDAKKPWRRLVMKGAKKHANGLWFVKEMRLDGDDWKTQVIFDFAEKNDIGVGSQD